MQSATQYPIYPAFNTPNAPLPPIMTTAPSDTPQPPSHPTTFINEQWSSGICGCCTGEDKNPGFFCLACICGGVAQGLLLNELDLSSSFIIPALCYESLDMISGRSLLLLITSNFRINLVKRLNRKEDPITSLVTVFCCYPCALAQIDRDSKAAGREYAFEKPKTTAQEIAAILGSIEGRAIPHVTSHETEPLVQNSMVHSVYVH